MLAALTSEECLLFYENTGRENERTLEFIAELSVATNRKITWLEFRPPKRKGAPPKEFGFEIVDFKRASRKGEPFAEMMEAINAYRDGKGEPPVAPWPKSRICTTHLKHRVLDHYLTSIGVYGHERLLGLRHDEPERVARLKGQETREKTLRAPLHEAGIRKIDVLEFWSEQSFDLGLPEYEGNCDGCFLKDEADIARAIGDDPERLAWWQGMADRWPRFGGEKKKSYAQLAYELITRKRIESALQRGDVPENDFRLEPKRFRLVLAQEKRRFENGPTRVSCACESSLGGDEELVDA
jgi:3'-phosphoadenosine 5'-phosphosulfate sulfotransferase (PAPS reductase)/FAD synthetase